MLPNTILNMSDFEKQFIIVFTIFKNTTTKFQENKEVSIILKTTVSFLNENNNILTILSMSHCKE